MARAKRFSIYLFWNFVLITVSRIEQEDCDGLTCLVSENHFLASAEHGHQPNMSDDILETSTILTRGHATQRQQPR